LLAISPYPERVYGSLVDVVLIALMIIFAVNGYRQGFLIGLLSFVGFFGGAAIGLQLGPFFADFFAQSAIRILVSLLTVLVVAIVGQAVASWIGARLRSSIRHPTGRTLDDLGGSLVSAVAVLVVAWLVAAPLASSPIPGLSRSVRSSALLHAINAVMPSQARALSEALRHTVDTSGFPDVFGNLDPTQVRQVPAPDPEMADSAVVARARRSVVKVLGTAPSCSRQIEGSGFVYTPRHVMTNAHVVAGTDNVSVESGGSRHPGRVVVYDAEKDLAVIYVPDLKVPALSFAPAPAKTGDDAIVLGFPLDGPFDAQSARVRDIGLIRGPDIYERRTVTRDIYTIRGLVRSGNSGGPLLDEDGAVLGVIFAAAADDAQTGFALTDKEADPVITSGHDATEPVDTGDCAQG
jgi:S1-C subfamily serine protease